MVLSTKMDFDYFDVFIELKSFLEVRIQKRRFVKIYLVDRDIKVAILITFEISKKKTNLYLPGCHYTIAKSVLVSRDKCQLRHNC